MKGKSVLQRIGDFMAGKGFYIVLFLCVSAIGISGYYLFSGMQIGWTDTPVAEATQMVVPPTASLLPTPEPVVEPEPAVEPEPTPEPEPEVTETMQTELVVEPEPTPALYVWPVWGEIVADFSLEVLAYDETMGDWRTHCGVDIEAELGTEVMAFASGTVTAVYDDDLMGTTVVIAHADGLESHYANLAVNPTVQVGDVVEVGAVIATVGDTAIAEREQSAHLHFELHQGDRTVDPAIYLP